MTGTNGRCVGGRGRWPSNTPQVTPAGLGSSTHPTAGRGPHELVQGLRGLQVPRLPEDTALADPTAHIGGLPIGFERVLIQLCFDCQCQKSKVRHLNKNELFIIRTQSGSQTSWTEPGLGFRPSGSRHLYAFPLPFPSPPLPRVWVKLSSCCCPFIKSHGPSALPSSPGKRLTVSCRSHIHNSRVECSLIRLSWCPAPGQSTVAR